MKKGAVSFYIPEENRDDVWWLVNFMHQRKVIDELSAGTMARKVFFQWVNQVKAAMEADIRAGGTQWTQQPVEITDHRRSPLSSFTATGGQQQ